MHVMACYLIGGYVMLAEGGRRPTLPTTFVTPIHPLKRQKSLGAIDRFTSKNPPFYHHSPIRTAKMSRRGVAVVGLAAAGGVGYYLYSAGGDPKVAQKNFEGLSTIAHHGITALLTFVSFSRRCRGPSQVQIGNPGQGA